MKYSWVIFLGITSGFLYGQAIEQNLLAKADLDQMLFEEEAFPFHDFLSTDSFESFEIDPIQPFELDAALKQAEKKTPKASELSKPKTVLPLDWQTEMVKKDSDALPLEAFKVDEEIPLGNTQENDWKPKIKGKRSTLLNRVSEDSPYFETAEEEISKEAEKLKEEQNFNNKFCEKNLTANTSGKEIEKNHLKQDLLVLKAHAIWEEDLYEAFIFLSEAYKIDPKNPWVLYQRGLLFEDLCRLEDALSSYEKAARYSQGNLFYLYTLFQFQLKEGRFKEAVQSLKELQLKDSSIQIQEEAIFWGKVIVPIISPSSFSWNCENVKSSYLSFLTSLDSQEFWNQKKWEELGLFISNLEELNSVFWLRVLGYIQQGQEKEALKLVQAVSFPVNGIEKKMIDSLHYLLEYRSRRGNVDSHAPLSENSIEIFKKNLEESALYFKQTGELPKINTSLDRLMMDKAAFLYFFTLYEWSNAALLLYPIDKLPKSIPDFLKVEIIKEIYELKGALEAIGYAAVQSKSTVISLSLGELFLAVGQENMGIQTLTEIEEISSKEGEKAALLVAFYWMEKKGYQEAIKTVFKNPFLRLSLKGKELLAKAYLETGNVEKAEAIYKEIEKNSPLAKSYFATKAFKQGDLVKARTLTEELLEIYPDSETLQENLEKIFMEQKELKRK